MSIQFINREVPRKILLNPGPATTSEEVKSALICCDICPREKEFGDLIKGVKFKILSVVDCYQSHDCVLLGSSGTGAIESCLTSSLEDGRKVLIIENGAYGKRMAQICDSFSIPYEILSFELNKRIDLTQVSNYLEANHLDIGLFAFVHHETTTGILNDAFSLLSIAKEYGILTMVDAMSSFGGVPLEVAMGSIDFLVASSNKCLHGFAGISFILLKKETVEVLRSIKPKSFYFSLYQNYISQKEKGQFLFTPPIQTLYALDAALDEFFEEGGELARSNKYRMLFTSLYDGMMSMGFVPFLDRADNSNILTTFFEPRWDGYSFEGMHEYFFKRDITIYPGKIGKENTFRISNIGDLSPEDIDLFLGIMKNYIESYSDTENI